jgi:putative ABC transport system ATP-binding protein
MKNNIVQLVDIVKTYTIDDVIIPILTHLSLTVTQGEMLAILGPSGSGKSTLMNIIGLLDHAYQGDYWLRDEHIASLHDDALAHLRNQRIGFVFQQFHLLPRLTALQNVALPLTYRQLPPSLIQTRALEALHHVGMKTFAERRPSQLSGGQQQRVAIARALIGEPDVILADEPTGALDSRTSNEIMTIFEKLHSEGRTLILITHEEQVAARCQRQITLADGHIILDTQA